MSYYINSETCKSCKLCIEVCPCKIIDIDENKKVFFVENRIFACVKCGQCMSVCSSKSVFVDNFDYEKDFEKIPKKNILYDDYFDFLKQRRSIRNFQKKEVSKEEIFKILSSLEYAPYGSAPNEVHITVITDMSKIEKALPLMSDFLNVKIVKWLENPFMRMMIKKKKGEEIFSTLKNHLYPIAKSGNYDLSRGNTITRNAPLIIVFHAPIDAEEHTQNAMIYATIASYTAQTLGLGVTFNGLIPACLNKLPELKKIFEIPQNHDSVISLMIGYPKYHYQRTVIRKKTNVKFI
jgi:NAD-dependent dihydropyrimidine dehydrogenase PreA subunit/signal recognition particle subunit SEC65